MVILFCHDYSSCTLSARLVIDTCVLCRMTEALPVAITSLLPLILFPFFQILDADQTAEEYFNDTTYVFIGSTLVAFAMEKVSCSCVTLI